MMKQHCHKSTFESDEYFFVEGCHILELLNSPEDKELSVARARVEPGVETALHQLKDVTERYLIQSGEGLARIGDAAPFTVKANDVIVIPAGMPQKIKNTGENDLVFLALCTPRFTPECYVELEERNAK